MNFTYVLFLLTFLGYPIVGLALYRMFSAKSVLVYLKAALPILIIHNSLFFLGYSIKGDYADYLLFSLDYLCFCLLVIGSNTRKNIVIKISKVFGWMVVILGYIAGFIGVLFFTIASQDYECDIKMHFKNATDTYELRRYTFDFDRTKYTYDTYKTLGNFPFEKRIDETVLFDTVTDGPFRIVDSMNTKRYLILQLNSNNRHIKEIK